MSLADLLDRHRAGDTAATSSLIERLMPLADKQLASDLARGRLLRYIDRDDLRSQLYMDLTTAVDRLLRNDVTAADVEKYVSAELRHSLSHCLRTESDDLLGDGAPIKRCRGARLHDRENVETEYTNDDETHIKRVPALDDPHIATDYPRRASRFDQRTPEEQLIEIAERQSIDADHCLSVARSSLERKVSRLLAAGHDVADIADTMPGVSHRQVINVISRLLSRAA